MPLINRLFTSYPRRIQNEKIPFFISCHLYKPRCKGGSIVWLSQFNFLFLLVVISCPVNQYFLQLNAYFVHFLPSENIPHKLTINSQVNLLKCPPYYTTKNIGILYFAQIFLATGNCPTTRRRRQLNKDSQGVVIQKHREGPSIRTEVRCLRSYTKKHSESNFSYNFSRVSHSGAGRNIDSSHFGLGQEFIDTSHPDGMTNPVELVVDLICIVIVTN
mmetsp:Transcript_11636/g.17358  ORF Transcript_11636/g.17358 Transcript_11636/m.17358 type:complete len:217 (-) Transcript_11636:150-800(-)